MKHTPRDVTMRFVDSFNELRYRNKVKTKLEFCQAVGLATQSNLNRMMVENSPNEPSLTNLLLLCEKFNVSIDWLFFGKGEFLK